MLKGLLAAGITMGVAAVFPQTLVFPFLTALLGLIAGGYPGIAMADPLGGRAGVQWSVAVGILLFGLIGLWVSALFLAGAWLLHGLWSLFHRFLGGSGGIPEGYVRFCLSYDLVMAVFVVYMWGVGA